MEDREVIYEPHPVSPERKRELVRKGYKIIDAEFAPEGYKYPESERQKKSEKSADVDLKDAEKLKKLSVAKLQEILTGLNVKFETDANKDALVALIVAQ